MRQKHSWRKLILVLLIVGVGSGAGGYYLAQKHFNNDRARLDKRIETLNAQVESLTPKTSPAQQNYFVVLSPFGVKFPYSDRTYNLLYTPYNDVIYFDLEGSGSATPAPLKNGSCDETSNVSGLLGFLYRTTSSLLETSSVVPLGHLGDYYYYYNYPKPCSYTDPDKQIMDKAVNSLVGDLKQLKSSS